MCSIEEKLERVSKLPPFFRRYVDDTFALVRNSSTAASFLTTLNEAHLSINFTMETAANGRLPFAGIEITKTDHHLETSVYRKKTNKGLLLHYQSHVDIRYKRSLSMTMINRSNRLSSSPDLFSKECRNLKTVFLKLKYPERLIDSTISTCSLALNQTQTNSIVTNDNPIRIILPFS